MTESPPPTPVFRISFANATGLSAVYLVVAVAVELIRRAWAPRWADQLSLALEAFPARTLHLLGLLDPLREAWLEHRVSDLAVRAAYGATAVAVIFLLGTLVGSLMWGVTRLARRR